METLDGYLQKRVVLDLSSPYVCMGKLVRMDSHYFVLEDADLHDMRDSPTTRENYIVSSKMSGIKKNRKQVIVRASEVVGIALFENVIDSDADEE